MKFRIFKLSLITLLFSFTTAGCQEDEIIDEHYPFKLHYAIQNEQGQEVTQINQGENFYFYFSIENTSDRNTPIDDHHLFGNDELFKVFNYDNLNNEEYAGEIQSTVCSQVGGCLGQANTKFEFKLPWSSLKDTSINVICCYYLLEKQSSLPIGKYLIKYTGSIPYYYENESGDIVGDETHNYNLKYRFEIVK